MGERIKNYRRRIDLLLGADRMTTDGKHEDENNTDGQPTDGNSAGGKSADENNAGGKNGSKKTAEEWEELMEEHLQQIAFFQHERLVHLIVTMTVAILAVLALGFSVVTESPGFMLASVLLIILFFPYIMHYMLLENEVQKMYDQYDRILENIRKAQRK